MHREYQVRMSDIVPKITAPITVVGAGAIGGWATLTLAKMGAEDITVYDNDTVGIENVGTQLFGPPHIGRPKVDALQDIVGSLSGVKITAKNELYTGLESTRGIVVLGVDSMSARYQIHNNLKRNGSYGITRVFDFRMGAEVLSMYAYTPYEDCKYHNTLTDDSEAIQERCTAKATIYTATFIGGAVALVIKRFITNQPLKHIQFDMKNLGWYHVDAK